MKLNSIFPPDSFPSWITIYTGWNPARHGFLLSPDVFESTSENLMGYDAGLIRGHTFWDLASRAGKRVCILYPVLAYPPWEVNGTMLSRSLNKKVAIFPPSLMDKYPVSQVAGMSGKHPGTKNLGRWATMVREVVLEEASLGLQLSQDNEWDLFFIFFSELDIIQHYFWRYQDEADPTYPGPNPYQDTIKGFYKLMDDTIGQFMSQHPDATAMVFGDHGHGMRPPKTVNINEFLRQQGLLASRSSRANPLPKLMEKAKRRLLDFTHKHELDYWLVKLATLGPLRSRSLNYYLSTSFINQERTLAQLSFFSGPKSYPHGGIEINRGKLNETEYEALRQRLIDELLQLKEPRSGKKLVQWACRREELYQGPLLSRYPDVVFELEEGYGVYWAIHTPLIGTAYEHNLASGGHQKGAILLLSRPGTSGREMELVDIAPTILEMLGVRAETNFEGTSLFQRSDD